MQLTSEHHGTFKLNGFNLSKKGLYEPLSLLQVVFVYKRQLIRDFGSQKDNDYFSCLLIQFSYKNILLSKSEPPILISELLGVHINLLALKLVIISFTNKNLFEQNTLFQA